MEATQRQTDVINGFEYGRQVQKERTAEFVSRDLKELRKNLNHALYNAQDGHTEHAVANIFSAIESWRHVARQVGVEY
jgi:hypothetical protein